MSDNKTIYTDDGTPIPWIEKNKDEYLDKVTLVYGSTNSGKSTIIEEIMYLCKDHIPNYLVIAPSTSTAAYKKKLPLRCIKEDFTKKLLLTIWKRQSAFTQLYNISNDITILESLFKKIPSRETSIIVSAMMQSAEKHRALVNKNDTLNFAQKKTQITAIDAHLNKKLKIMYKKTIDRFRSNLEMMDLTDKEAVALEYLNINPRLMLIIDDRSEQFKGWMKLFKKGETNPIESIFYRGRHNYITAIIACHDDKLLDTELRKNARIAIYADSAALTCSLNKTQSGFSPQEKKIMFKIGNKVFDDSGSVPHHQKFVFIRNSPTPYRYTIADLYPEFQLGCGPMRDLTSAMPKLEDNLEDNPFVKDLVNSHSGKRPASKVQKR
jgi:GTP-binding protein EngB required for normal cell division